MIDAREFDQRALVAAHGRHVHGRASANPDAQERAKRRAALEVREQKAARAIDYWRNRRDSADMRLAVEREKYAEIVRQIEAL